MSRLQLLPLALIALSIACTNNEGDDGPADSGTADTGAPGDSGTGGEDATPVDTGPGPCQRDQGGPDNRGCNPGEVCNLAMDPPQCVPGRQCTTDSDCNACSELVNPADCGHGYHLTAWCDPNHGNVCTRSRSPCEPCEQDSDCGRQHPNFGGSMNPCVDYGNGQKFCGRPCTLGCPDGFACNANNVCTRAAGCADEPVICPEDPNPGVNCTSTAPSQICAGEVCEGTGGARCSTNDQPGALGICIGFCTQNSDCTDPATPICNPRNGICIAGCTKGNCPAGQVCHADGFCAPPCENDTDCTDNPKYGPNTYCNIPPPPVRPPPRYYKGGPNGYRDDYSCAPLGCERKVDCQVAGIVCDTTQAPPACVPGCYDRSDCLAGELCKDAPQGNYTEQECRALPDKPEGEDSIGVCCDPGCLDLELDCGFNQFCCGEDKAPGVMEPYENPNACLPVTATAATPALPGECFDMGVNPWCRTCQDNESCNMPRSGWTAGFNDVDGPGGGGLVNEQEWCFGIAMGVNVCSVTCNPELALMGVHTCPRLWRCGPLYYPCFQDADCNGLTCVDPNPNDMAPGACRCGENGSPTAACPQLSAAGPVDAPRCLEYGSLGVSPPGGQQGEFYCVASFNCTPPFLQVNMMTGETNYPEACGF